MTLFAWINADNVVVNVTVCEDELLTQLGVDVSTETQEQFYTQIINQQNIYAKMTSEVGNIRKQYAGIGYAYDADADVFVTPQPYSSWTLNSNHDWQPPTPKPDGDYFWNEETLAWCAI